MSKISDITNSSRLITDLHGRVESVVLPAKEYKKLINLLEDYGLGIAMKKALKDKMFSKKDALKMLGDD